MRRSYPNDRSRIIKDVSTPESRDRAVAEIASMFAEGEVKRRKALDAKSKRNYKILYYVCIVWCVIMLIHCIVTSFF